MGDITCSIRASGGDYQSISAFIAGEQCDLTSQAGVVAAELYNDWASGLSDAISLSGFTNPTSNYYVEIRAASGSGTEGTNSHGAQVDTGSRISKSTVGFACYVNVAYSRIVGIGIRNLYTNPANFPGVYGTVTNVTIDSCIIKCDGDAGYSLLAVSGANWTVKNNLVYNFVTPTTTGYGAIRVSAAGAALKHNCVFNGTGNGIVASVAQTGQDWRNNAVYGISNDDYEQNSSTGTFDYNGSEDGSAPGTNAVTLTEDPFTNSAGGDFTYPFDSECVDAGGATGCGVSTDCIGTARPQNTNYDIGWFEYVAEGSTAVPTTTATTAAPTSLAPTTTAPTSLAPTTLAPTTPAPTTLAPTTLAPTTLAPTTLAPTTLAPTTPPPTTKAPTTAAPTTGAPTTLAPTTAAPTTAVVATTVPPTTYVPHLPTTLAPTTPIPTTSEPPTTLAPTTEAPTSAPPTTAWQTSAPPTTKAPTTAPPTTVYPSTIPPTTVHVATTHPPTTFVPPTTEWQESEAPSTKPPTTKAPTTHPPTTEPPTTLPPTTKAPTTAPSTTVAPTTSAPTTAIPTTVPATTLTTAVPTTAPPVMCHQDLTSKITDELELTSKITKEIDLDGNLCR